MTALVHEESCFQDQGVQRGPPLQTPLEGKAVMHICVFTRGRSQRKNLVKVKKRNEIFTTSKDNPTAVPSQLSARQRQSNQATYCVCAKYR